MILVEREPGAFISAAVAPTADGWTVLHFSASAGPPFLMPLIHVATDDGPAEGFTVAWRIALREEVPPLDDRAQT